MERICESCKTPLPEVRIGHITENFCSKCLEEFQKSSGVTMQDFINRLPAPILVVDGDVRILSVNQSAAVLLRKTLQELGGKLGGQAIECVHAREPGGCGRTVHCESCTIRNCVNTTFLTGAPCIDVPAYPDTQYVREEQTLSISVTTEKHGKFVLLRIGHR